MNMREIKEIVALMNESGVTEFLIEREGFKLCIRKDSQTEKEELSTPGTAAAVAQSPQSEQREEAAKEDVKEGVYILSPMVGTYYGAPSPDSPPFVEIGREVDEDTVVCIIEAMKVMNEIKAEKKGKILEILVENGEPVEFGKKLMRIG
jgi:acetyl-CoA carboxylase biotin carboxyl carrier protein